MNTPAPLLAIMAAALALGLSLLAPGAATAQVSASDYVDCGIDKLKKNDLEGAEADFNRAIELDPKNALAHTGRADIMLAKGNLDAALAGYNRAIELDPKHPWAYHNLGIVRLRKGDLDGAIADFSRAIEINPRDSLAYNNRGNAKRAKGDLEGATADYNKARQFDPRPAMVAPKSAFEHALYSGTPAGKGDAPFASTAEKLVFDWKLPPSAPAEPVEIRWIAADTAGAAPRDTVITASKSEAGKSSGTFTLTRPTNGFPPGSYRVEIWQAGKMIHSKSFNIQK